MRLKALDLLGFGIWENSQDLNELHTKKASQENSEIISGKNVKVLEIDNHDLHINEHISYMLGGDYSQKYSQDPKIEQCFLSHIKQHKIFKSMEKNLENNQN